MRSEPLLLMTKAEALEEAARMRAHGWPEARAAILDEERHLVEEAWGRPDRVWYIQADSGKVLCRDGYVREDW